MNNNLKAYLGSFGLSNVIVDTIIASSVLNDSMSLSNGVEKGIICFGTTFSITLFACLNEFDLSCTKTKKK